MPLCGAPFKIRSAFVCFIHRADEFQHFCQCFHILRGGDIGAGAGALEPGVDDQLLQLFQLLLYPVTDANFDTESYRTFAEGPWLTREAMKWFWDAYAPDARRRGEITASPLRATPEQLAGLPPAMIITAENDVLRDEGEAYARKLIEAGVHVACVRYNNTHHDFMMLNALAETTPTRAAVAQAAAALKKMLH